MKFIIKRIEPIICNMMPEMELGSLSAKKHGQLRLMAAYTESIHHLWAKNRGDKLLFGSIELRACLKIGQAGSFVRKYRV